VRKSRAMNQEICDSVLEKVVVRYVQKTDKQLEYISTCAKDIMVESTRHCILFNYKYFD
jgi:predicted transcriptional regulator